MKTLFCANSYKINNFDNITGICFLLYRNEIRIERLKGGRVEGLKRANLHFSI